MGKLSDFLFIAFNIIIPQNYNYFRKIIKKNKLIKDFSNETEIIVKF